MATEEFDCPGCGRSVDREAASRSGTVGDLDDDRWTTLCCPDCGHRLKTVFVPPGE